LKIQVTYTYGLPPDAQEAVALLTAADLPGMVEAMNIEEARNELLKQIPPEEQLRFTVHAVSFLDRGYYAKLAQEGQEWFTQRTGQDIGSEFDDQELIYLRNIVYFRAEMLCAVDREKVGAEVRYKAERALVPYGAIPKWEAAFVPQEWVTLDGMAEKMPVELLDSWRDATRHLNAGVLSSIPDFLAVRRVTSSVLA